MLIRITIILSIFLAACSSTPAIVQQELDEESTSRFALTSDYRIGVDDVLQVTVWGEPELSVTIPVRPDGKISVPLIGDTPAGGLTPMEVAGNIQGKLADYIRDPQVAVIVADLKSHEYLTRVRVTGAVRQQSSIPYRQGMTVLDAVLQSGGVNEFAAPDKTKLYRKRNKETIVVPILLDALVNKGQLDWNYELQPGDVITVPERLF